MLDRLVHPRISGASEAPAMFVLTAVHTKTQRSWRLAESYRVEAISLREPTRYLFCIVYGRTAIAPRARADSCANMLVVEGPIGKMVNVVLLLVSRDLA